MDPINSAVYLVATIRPWNIEAYNKIICRFPGEWHLVTDPGQLTESYLADLKPRLIFFPHWSSIVPTQITSEFECVCFHETDVPFGRGGSPIQNLIERGHTESVVTALKMGPELDSGDVYLKRPFSLHGSAEEIFIRVSHLVASMILEIITTRPVPKAQDGPVTLFKRRTPEQSLISGLEPDLNALHDKIRMLDADEYPQARIELGQYRFSFSRASLTVKGIHADVLIEKKR